MHLYKTNKFYLIHKVHLALTKMISVRSRFYKELCKEEMAPMNH